MRPRDKEKFAELIAGVMAYHRQPVTDAVIGVWWRGCQRWEMEEVTRGLDQLTMDADLGKFPPTLGGLNKVLAGSTTDRAAIAWGKVHDTMAAVGAYQDVVFDDPAIHAAVEDCGGWVKMCRTETADLSYLQHRFCLQHRAYTDRGQFDYPKRLMGDRSPDSDYLSRGLPPPAPAVIGELKAVRLVYRGGGVDKTRIAFASVDTLLLGGSTDVAKRLGVNRG